MKILSHITRGNGGRRVLPWLYAACALWFVLAGTTTAADWPTYRGTHRRTGNIDNRRGPKVPQVHWVHKAGEHFVASVVPVHGALYVSGLGAFNTGIFHCMALQPDSPRRVLWSKGTPFIKRPTVCSPVAVGGLVVFGDGMHQTDDAILYCVQAETGLPVWQLPVPGRLVHLEASPTIHNGRIYTGGGAAGIICVDLNRVTLEGIEQDLSSAYAVVEKHWEELNARYRQESRKMEFAVPPSHDMLPKPAPKLLWQAGKDSWHVDAPVVVVNDMVLAGSAYLDEEKVGKRSLLCLRAKDGGVVWEVALKHNPWAGATVSGSTALVGCSNIRFDVAKANDAKGEVVAVNIADGKIKWRKEIPGGILSPVAVEDDVAVLTATDGKIRAYSVATGEGLWVHDAGRPFFAGPALAGGMVYAADLGAVVHAVSRRSGKKEWTLNVPKEPGVQVPGMVYGAPLVHDGKIYLSTCNIEGENADKPGMIVCIGEKRDRREAGAEIVVDKAKKSVTIPCKIAPRKLASLEDIYPLEVIATFPSPLGEKAHETVVTFASRPSDVHKAFEGMGLKPGKPVKGDGRSSGPAVRILLQFRGLSGEMETIPIENALVDARTGRRMPPLSWRFTGSSLREPDPGEQTRRYGADLTGTLITLFPVSDETVFQSDLAIGQRRVVRLDTNKDLLPPEDTPVSLIIMAADAGKEDTAAPEGGADAAVGFTVPYIVTAPAASYGSELVRAEAVPPLGPVRVREKPYPVLARDKRPVRHAPAEAPQSREPASATPLPPPQRLATGPLARVRGVDPMDTAILPVTMRSGKAPPSGTIGGKNLSREGVLARVPSLREDKVPFRSLTLSNPFATAEAVRLDQSPGDDDPLGSIPVLSPVAPEQVAPTVEVNKPNPPAKASNSTTDVIFQAGGSWKYLDDGSDPGAGWSTAKYEDAAWKTGPAPMGYGNGNEATTVASGPAGAKHITTYFRTTFAVKDVSELESLILKLVRDDGVVVFLNGREVVRDNMPQGVITFQTPAAGSVGGIDEQAFQVHEIGKDGIVKGMNVLAAEIHQVGPGSSDISFDLELLGRFVPSAPRAQ